MDKQSRECPACGYVIDYVPRNKSIVLSYLKGTSVKTIAIAHDLSESRVRYLIRMGFHRLKWLPSKEEVAEVWPGGNENYEYTLRRRHFQMSHYRMYAKFLIPLVEGMDWK